mmetsp:Transcript_52682/g.111920  ORF Transcript_52682/g.111920 Transcript_52682/m.111920 type:complete len:81 (-) Transcript_52682:267-509(-)
MRLSIVGRAVDRILESSSSTGPLYFSLGSDDINLDHDEMLPSMSNSFDADPAPAAATSASSDMNNEERHLRQWKDGSRVL